MTNTTGANNRDTAAHSSTTRTPGADWVAGAVTETNRPATEQVLETNPSTSGRTAATGTVAEAVRASSARRHGDVERYGRQGVAAARQAASEHLLLSVMATAGLAFGLGYLIGRYSRQTQDQWYDRADADTGRYPYQARQSGIESGPATGGYGYRVGASDTSGGSTTSSYGYRPRYTE
jgi:hypothetical protein